MISRNIFTDLLLMVILICLQNYVFNRFTISGIYAPVIYPVFILFYPFYRNNYIFLALSFLIGLGIDAFLGTWGINAFASTFIAYFRTLLFRTSTDSSHDSFSFQSLQWSQFISYILVSILIHQFLVQTIEFFKPERFLEILINVFFTTLISFAFIILYALVFKIKEKV